MTKYRIEPKRDFGSGPGFLIDGRYVKKGFIVTDGICNIMPGATWFETVAEARTALRIYLEVEDERGDSNLFWARLRACQKGR